MEATHQAIIEAKRKAKESEDYGLCLKNHVCPKCAKGLYIKNNYNGFWTILIYKYVCSNKKCDFTETII